MRFRLLQPGCRCCCGFDFPSRLEESLLWKKHRHAVAAHPNEGFSFAGGQERKASIYWQSVRGRVSVRVRVCAWWRCERHSLLCTIRIHRLGGRDVTSVLEAAASSPSPHFDYAANVNGGCWATSSTGTGTSLALWIHTHTVGGRKEGR